MAAIQGYQCEFIDSVFDGLYCKKCSHVARRLTVITCCGESFCQACLADTQEQDKTCPACGKKDYSSFQHAKNQERIGSLRVYCSMKEKGCNWSGTLDLLDTHLNPELDNCQFVDVLCPLNCQQGVPKSMIEQHVAQECKKRPHVCQYCNYKATYTEVMDVHLLECKYVPLQCPNRCGVTFERDFLEDHMKICRLEEVQCEFLGIGCEGLFKREDEEEHGKQNVQKHLILMASLAKELQQQLLEQDRKHKEEKERLKKKIKEQEKMLGEQGMKILQQDKELKKNIGILNDAQEVKSELQHIKQKLFYLTIKSEQNETKVSKVSAMIHRKFEMRNFHKEKAKDKHNDWKSPAMYTHACGYKFCIGVDANGHYMGQGQSICVELYAMPGEYDDHLKWPAEVDFTVELINQRGGANVSHSLVSTTWKRPAQLSWVAVFNRQSGRYFGGFLEHSKLGQFLINDTLHFYISEIHVEV